MDDVFVMVSWVRDWVSEPIVVKSNLSIFYHQLQSVTPLYTVIIAWNTSFWLSESNTAQTVTIIHCFWSHLLSILWSWYIILLHQILTQWLPVISHCYSQSASEQWLRIHITSSTNKNVLLSSTTKSRTSFSLVRLPNTRVVSRRVSACSTVISFDSTNSHR